MKDIFSSARDFTTFDYLISHSCLLIRAQARGAYRKNVDVIFNAVAYMQMHTHFRGLTIRAGRSTEAALLPASAAKLLQYRAGLQLFELVSEGTSHYIIAGVVGVFENELPPMQSSLTADETQCGVELASSISKPFFARLFGS